MWKVLLAEDEVFVRESVREIIDWESMGFTVVGEAGNGTEALAMIREEKPDLVLTDIIMPGMDGIELLRQTREAGIRSKFVMLTCMSEFEYIRQAMEYGASNYILKLSMNVKDLRETLGKIRAELEKEERQREERRGGAPRDGYAADGWAAIGAGRAPGVTPPPGARHAQGEPLAGAAGPVPGGTPPHGAGPVPGMTPPHGASHAQDGPLGAYEAGSVPAEAGSEERITHPEVNKIIAYIHENYHEDLSVKFLSQYVMMGENYVSALFKKKTGRTLIHYLHQVRIDKAIWYLRNTSLPVSEIGQKVGFANDNYFIKIFKRHTKRTPSLYRKEHRQYGGD